MYIAFFLYDTYMGFCRLAYWVRITRGLPRTLRFLAVWRRAIMGVTHADDLFDAALSRIDAEQRCRLVVAKAGTELKSLSNAALAQYFICWLSEQPEWRAAYGNMPAFFAAVRKGDPKALADLSAYREHFMRMFKSELQRN